VSGIKKSLGRIRRSSRRADLKTRKAIRRDHKRSSGGKKLDKVMNPELPEIEEDLLMPIPDDSLEETNARKRRAMSAGTGRQSTILTGLGG
jgi:coproporphyrinogen III oxidase-like Fe-S oxidoreductase